MYKVSAADLRQMFEGTVVMYKKRPVFVVKISGTFDAQILHMQSRKTEVIKCNINTFTPCCRRLGMMNVNDSVVYVTRLPMRQYAVGYSRDTLRIRPLDGALYPRGRVDTTMLAYEVNTEAFANILFGKYPSFRQSIEQSQVIAGTMAWDRQFAVSNGKQVFYKNKCVGTVNGKSVEDILFKPEYKHLSILLNKGYENTITVAP